MRPCVPSGRRADRRFCHTEISQAREGAATLECYQDLEALEIPENAGILLECVMNLTANESSGKTKKMQEKGEDKVAEKVLEGIRHLSEHTAYLAVVTGQVDGDIDSYSEETRTYQKILGRDQSEDRRMAKSRSRRWCGSPYR